MKKVKLDERTAAARALLDNPLFERLMDELEAAAINGCVNAKLTDHETRAAFAAEARAIRNFRGKLRFLREQARAGGTGAPA
jgi:Mg-chelatase subunit ChlI